MLSQSPTALARLQHEMEILEHEFRSSWQWMQRCGTWHGGSKACWALRVRKATQASAKPRRSAACGKPGLSEKKGSNLTKQFFCLKKVVQEGITPLFYKRVEEEKPVTQEVYSRAALDGEEQRQRSKQHWKTCGTRGRCLPTCLDQTCRARRMQAQKETSQDQKARNQCRPNEEEWQR